jgi:hypothetical protein
VEIDLYNLLTPRIKLNTAKMALNANQSINKLELTNMLKYKTKV